MRKRKSLQDKALLALKEAVKEVVENHKKSGRPLAVWRNGKVVRLSVKTIRKDGRKQSHR